MFLLEYEIKCVNVDESEKKLCNDNLTSNREIVCCALAAHKAAAKSTVKCLDGNGGCGIHGMLWQKYLGENICVVINEMHANRIDIIRNNLRENDLEVDVLNEDTCLLLRKRQFDFIFLNCNTTASQYLDSVFYSLQEHALLVITTSEDSSLYWQAPIVALRNYGCVIAKTSYHRELAARVVIAEMARAAARYSKGLEILCTIGFKSQQSFTIIAKVKKGGSYVKASLGNIKRLVHCSLCEDRQFVPNSDFVIDSPSSLLNCECTKTAPGKLVNELGPMWSGDIFCTEFIESMIAHSKNTPWENSTKTLLGQILCEAQCKGSKMDETPAKKIKLSNKEQMPYFYFNTHRHRPKGQHLIKMTKIIELLHRNGFRASRTHFDPEAVRTDASLNEFVSALEKQG